jgi:NAD(P)-dependent dehydrogenase (short-subunit alcohol dehydrogenase family)
VIDLAGRRAVITGASRGIGAAAAQALAARGVRVVTGSRSSGGTRQGGDVTPLACDVRDPDAVARFVADAAEILGGIDIAVVNAGVGAYGDFLDMPRHVVEDILDVNVKGFVHTIREVLPRLMESDAGELVGITSIAGQHAPAGESVYAASKFAQVGFMRAIDHELYSRGVRCSILCPGGVATDFAMGRGRTPDMPALAQMMQPEEVAEAVVFALSRPRTHRVLETSLVPMAEDSL